MLFEVTSADIEAAIGVPFASPTDEQWAAMCAAAAMGYVGGLPIAVDDTAAPQVEQATTMLAVNLYHRRPNGAVAPDFAGEGFQVTPALDPIISRLLRLGPFQPAVIA